LVAPFKNFLRGKLVLGDGVYET